MVGSNWRVRLVEFDFICLRRIVVSEKEKRKEKRTKAGINLVIMLLGIHLECDIRTYGYILK